MHGQNWPVVNLPAVLFYSQPREYVTFGFFFYILVSLPLEKIVCEWYEFSSVLALIILENLDWDWWRLCHSLTWQSSAKGRWRVNSWLAISNIRLKKIAFFHVCCSGFSQGWKSLYNTAVYVISEYKFSPWTRSFWISPRNQAPFDICQTSSSNLLNFTEHIKVYLTISFPSFFPVFAFIGAATAFETYFVTLHMRPGNWCFQNGVVYSRI